MRVTTPRVVRECEISGTRVEFDGAPAIVTAIRDATERRELERRLTLTDRLASVGTLAAGVAHEINNPLSCVLSNLQSGPPVTRAVSAPEPAEPPPEYDLADPVPAE